MKSRTYTYGNGRLEVIFGDITESAAEVIVSSDDHYISMHGGVSAAILRAGGQQIMIDAAKKVPAKLGDVVVTTAGQLQAQYVFHAITIRDSNSPSQAAQVVRPCVSRCFDLLEALSLSSISFPAIGAGSAGFPYEVVAVEMARVISERLNQARQPLAVTLHLFDQSRDMQPLDYISFFEEFARRVPQLHPVEATEAVPPVARDRAADSVPPAPKEQDTRVELNDLTNERARLEDQLAAMGDASPQAREIRARLEVIAKERIRLLQLLQNTQKKAVSLFISYSHKDQEYRTELEKHLSILKQSGVIETWTDRMIPAGADWAGEIDRNLNSAQIILLLISSDFMASDYCSKIEVRRAMERHQAGEAIVIPVILRAVLWDGAPFAKLQALPTDAKPVRSWPDQDAAFQDIAQGLRKIVESAASMSKAQSAQG